MKGLREHEEAAAVSNRVLSTTVVFCRNSDNATCRGYVGKTGVVISTTSFLSRHTGPPNLSFVACLVSAPQAYVQLDPIERSIITYLGSAYRSFLINVRATRQLLVFCVILAICVKLFHNTLVVFELAQSIILRNPGDMAIFTW